VGLDVVVRPSAWGDCHCEKMRLSDFEKKQEDSRIFEAI